MAIRVRPCEQFSLGEGDRRVMNIYTSITPISTVEEFQAACRQNRGFQLAAGGRIGCHILGEAAYQGNFNVVEHILANLGKATLDMGNQQGVTPLMAACQSARRDPVTVPQIYRTVEVLLQHHADPNLATTLYSIDSRGDTLSGATPLWAAAKARKVALIQLLLTHGAELGNCPLTREDKQSLAQAQVGLANYRTEVSAALDPHLLPVLATIAADYAGPPPYEAGPE